MKSEGNQKRRGRPANKVKKVGILLKVEPDAARYIRAEAKKKKRTNGEFVTICVARSGKTVEPRITFKFRPRAERARFISNQPARSAA